MYLRCIGVLKSYRGRAFVDCLIDNYKKRNNTMLPSLTVLHVVLLSFFASFSFATGVPEMNDTTIESAYATDVSDIVIGFPDVTGAYCDLMNGTITVNVQGGPDPDLEYSIDAGVTWQDDFFFGGLGIDDYLIIVRRKSDPSCFSTSTAQIAAGPDLVINDFTFGCQAGENSADYIVNVAGGTAEYTLSYALPGGGTFTTTSFDGAIPFEITDIVEGNYTIFVEDRLGCVKDTTFFVEECCAFRFECLSQPTVLPCMSDLPPIDSVYLDGITTGSSDLDSLVAQNLLLITDRCVDGIVSAVDITVNTPTDCINDTLKINRTYTIDLEGIEYTCIQEYNVLSFQDALLTETASDLTLECDEAGHQNAINQWLTNNAGAEVSSCGSNPAWSHDYTPGDENTGCGLTGSVIVNFTFTDDCGTLLTTEALITIDDSTPPVFVTSVENLSLDCGMDDSQIADWLDNQGTAMIEDACSDVTISNDYTGFMPSCEQSGEMIVTFTATDDCGNAATTTALILVTDPDAYSVLCPSDLEVDLEDPNLLTTVNSWLELATTDDPCLAVDYDVTNDFDPADLEVECDYLSIAVTFTAINDCGIEKSCTANIVAAQDISGLVNCPDPLTVECGDPDNDNIIANWLATASAEDFEGNEITLNNDFTIVETNCGITEILFSGVDDCGQDVNCSTQLIVEDTTVPDILCPQELNLTCGADMAAINDWIASVTATDNCGIAIIENDFGDADFTITCGDSGHYDVSFTATDICGNQSVCVGRINIFDDSNIGITCPDNLILDSSVTDIDAAVQDWIATASVVDPCDFGLEISNNYGPETIIFDCGFIMGEVTFEIASACGAVASCTATISGNVDVSPVINCPTDLTLTCGEDTEATLNAWIAGVTAQDFAGFDIPVTNNLPEDLGTVCGEVEVVFITTDDCDNTLSCAHVITIEDNELPQIICESERTIDLSLGSAQSQINEILETTGLLDNCSEVTLDYSFNSNVSDLGCGDVETMTLIATDACGNVAECETEVSFIDFNDIFIDCPDPLSVSCLEDDLEAYIYDYLLSANVQTSRLDAELTFDYDPDLVSDACNDYISFDVHYVAVDECGTEETCVVPVEILPEMKVYIPNVFTPDGDGLNDMVTVYANKNVVIVKEWFIFDRWGEVVFRGVDFNPNTDQEGWNGMFKGRLADQNVYSYIVTVVDDFNRERTQTGTITLMK